MSVHYLSATMAILTDFTTYDEIRAVLGVSDEELENSTLALPLYVQELQLALEAVYPTVEALYTSFVGSPLMSPEQQKFVDVVRIYSAYATSNVLLTSLPIFAPRRITDGKAETERVTDPFKDVREGVELRMAQLRARLLSLLGILGTVVDPAPGRVYFAAAGLAVNPITNV